MYSLVRNTEPSPIMLAVILQVTFAIGKSETHPILKEKLLEELFNWRPKYLA